MQEGLASLKAVMDAKNPACFVRKFVDQRQKTAHLLAPPSRGSSSDVCPNCGLLSRRGHVPVSAEWVRAGD